MAVLDGPGPSAADPGAATFRIRLIMERGMMRQGGQPWLSFRPAAPGWTPGMTPGMALEDMWI